jgi:hypothetical protein
MAYNHKEIANNIERLVKTTGKVHVTKEALIDVIDLPKDISDAGLIYHTSKIHKILKEKGLMLRYDIECKAYRVKPEEKPEKTKTDTATIEPTKPEEAQTEQEADPTEELMPKWTEVLESIEKNPSKIYELNSILQEFGLKAVLKIQIEQL